MVLEIFKYEKYQKNTAVFQIESSNLYSKIHRLINCYFQLKMARFQMTDETTTAVVSEAILARTQALQNNVGRQPDVQYLSAETMELIEVGWHAK